ncbi:MAG TPA: acyltransferase [Chitinophagaceae bacterium]|jgi:peptidoglycan/LPS O-acetylase OafA/YrhL|nr:acyltransferase [Chitinophagaceae bacterium]
MEKQPVGTELAVTKKLYGLDLLRALAITLVFLAHYGGQFSHPEWAEPLKEFGWTGVDLFFVLSGFLIASPLFGQIAAHKKISLREFFLKRFFRIIPAYLFVVCIYFLFAAAREREGLAPLWKYLTFTQNLGLDLRYHGTFSHAWSLCIEEQFYLCFPLILTALVYFKLIRKGYILLLLLFLAGFAARSYAWHDLVVPHIEDNDFGILWYKWLYYPTYARLDGLLIGIGIAALFCFRPRLKERIQRYGNLLIFLSLLVFTATYFLCSDERSAFASIAGFPRVDIGFGLLVAGAVSPSGFLYRFNSKAISTIATLSYAFYLTHKIAIHITQEQVSKFNIEEDSTLMFFICIITSLATAFLINKIVERPFLKLRNRIIGART